MNEPKPETVLAAPQKKKEGDHWKYACGINLSVLCPTVASTRFPRKGVRSWRAQVWSKHISALHHLAWVYLPAKQLSQWAAKDRTWRRITHTPSDKWSLFAVFLSLADCLQNYRSWPDGTEITEVRHSPPP